MVDDEDYEFLNQYKWHFTAKGYASRKVHFPSSRAKQVGKEFLMHRVIAFATPDYQVDHIDGNKLNNQKSNLRLCTNSQNHMNKKLQSNSSSGYKGVSFEKSINRYRAYINFEGKRYNLKTHSTPEQAAEAYNLKAKELFGKFANLNDIQLKPTTPTSRNTA